MHNHSAIGLVGLGVMGSNLAQNFADHDITVHAWDRSASVRNSLTAIGSPCIWIQDSLEALVDALAQPRIILLMVNAGEAVDQVIAQLEPILVPGDIVIDGGNSHFADTTRRAETLAKKSIHFVGAGISGGESGARHGPAIMPGGEQVAWPVIKPLLQAIAASADGEPCCSWIGPAGSGHFVKMVHNGIEYADMQLIAETYHIMHQGLGIKHDGIRDVFTQWNQGELASYLVEITADIMGASESGKPLVDNILDSAGQKGTGAWTAVSGLSMGVPISMISEAVFARSLSARKDLRTEAAKFFQGPDTAFTTDQQTTLVALADAFLAARIVAYAQGFSLLQQASREFNWKLDFAAIASLWRGGCIIRSALLDPISAAFTTNPDLADLLLADHFSQRLRQHQGPWRQVVSQAVNHGIPVPCLSAALNYYDGFRSAILPANLLQAQRHFFGAHPVVRLG
jgi:6-phosphogluconate dehydrogenase